MNIGITATGVYIPYYVMKRETIAKQWSDRGLKGERSLCNADEDSVTMAVEAAVNCLQNEKREVVDGLYFASVTAPYAEKSHSVLIAKVCDLKNTADTADFSGGTRAGMTAVKAAYHAINSGSSNSILVTSADSRNGYPKSQQEQLFGDAAAALLIGKEEVIAAIESTMSFNVEITDIWRNAKEDYVQTGEGRFIKTAGYTYAVVNCVKRFLAKEDLSVNDISTFIFPAQDLKDPAAIAKAVGVQPEKVQDPLMLQVGDCGVAQPLLMLSAALENVKPGDRILWASYGNGTDVILLRVTEEILKWKNKGQLKRYIDTRQYLEAYPRFLSFRGLLEAVPGEPFKISPSTTVYWRDQNSILSLHGSKCKKCGQIMFPINRICYSCHSKDEYDEIRLYDRQFKLFTYSIDQLAGRSDDPVIGQAVAEDAEGTRIYMLITDFVREEISIGMPLEFTFRKMHHLGGFVNYYWKLRPLRKGSDTYVSER